MAAGTPTYEIPFGGNAFITHRQRPNAPEVITDAGLGNWMDSGSVCSLMFHVHAKEQAECPSEVAFHFGLKLYVARGGQSMIRVALGAGEDGQGRQGQGQVYFIHISGDTPHIVPVGEFRVQLNKCQHHVQIDLQGIENTAGFFADVSHGIVSNLRSSSGSGQNRKPALRLSFVDSAFSFHFGRRGPSVHLNYVVPVSAGKEPIEYFYNEIVVPSGQDVLGAYFCAIGFNGGYFGIQVNSATERRILFSIWSAFETDCPDSIPPEYKVQLLKKGETVHVQPFGCEGSGQQSFLRYDWRAGKRYKFLVRGAPDESESRSTKFTAWFSSPDHANGLWQLIASFHKPKVAANTYLAGMYSFAENFEPDMGHVQRKVYFGNQWARTARGNWVPVNQAHFTGDDTSKECRKDYAGGTENGLFYLQHCGFLCDRVDTNQMFCCGQSGQISHTIPDVVVEQLP